MTRDSTVLSRQQFMVGVAGAGVTAPLGSVVRGQAAPASAQFAPPTSGTLGVDMHNHIDVPLAAGDVPGSPRPSRSRALPHPREAVVVRVRARGELHQAGAVDVHHVDVRRQPARHHIEREP